MYFDAINFYDIIAQAMSQSWLIDEIKFDEDVKIEDIIETPDGSDYGYFIQVDLELPDEIKQEQKASLFVLKIKVFIKTNLVII